MNIINLDILRQPMNWALVAFVLVMLIFVTHFTRTALNKDY